ncbi:DUF6730 family protein [uncultured Maribacter sp.]|uniref:DUF6730 family protein n=1 Tax=uncultured Maribacter sp. TaxID=431308 RepID=UPI0030EEE5DD|tara:strand:- start:40516 stop:40989 length:474 start_codon:yes stop_codon:yes gene_type:complete
MGYKKLDEVMELLNDELDGFNKTVDKLELLTQNIDNIKIKSDTSEFERLLREHLNFKKTKSTDLQKSLFDIDNQISKARLIPKIQLWLHYSIWFVSLVTIGYLGFQVSRIGTLKDEAFAKGKLETMSNVQGYFIQNPEHYESYQKWRKENKRVPNQK